MHAVLVKALTVVGVKASNNEETEVEEPSILGQRIKEYIDKNYAEPITLQSMGEALNISPYYLSHASDVELAMQRRIKNALDERHILNDHKSYLA